MSESLQDQAVEYAMGLMSTEDRANFERELDRNPALRELTSDYTAICSVLVLSLIAQNPPETLRAKILACAAASEPHNNIVPFPPSRAWIPWAIAASFAVFAGVIMFQNVRLQTRNALLAEQSTWSRVQLSVLQPTPEAPGATARIAWNPVLKQGRLWTSNLPKLPPDKSYQLWVFESGNPQPISAGVFEPGVPNETSFRSTTPISTAAKFAVTIEKQGGVPIPAGPVVLVGEIES